ncbi:MAG TPA: hypothetical protein VGR84_10700 [Candidatus Acidoferrales bacterium]|nr:hypothetical protein [Candidatus Acidoferrales bacterium]
MSFVLSRRSQIARPAQTIEGFPGDTGIPNFQQALNNQPLHRVGGKMKLSCQCRSRKTFRMDAAALAQHSEAITYGGF